MRRRHPRGRWTALLALLALACGPPMPNDPLRVRSDAPGLSGLCVGPGGALWAIPEEQRALLRIDRDTGAVTAHPVEGLPEGLEAEALSYRGQGEFVIGTEAAGDQRAHDALVVLRFDGSVARVLETYECPYELWGLMGMDNRGLEGVCALDEDILIAAEVTGTESGRRYAPMGWRNGSGEWTAYGVWLTTETGKLAGIDCERTATGGARVLAVERHFGVTRILGFDLPAPGAPRSQAIEPRVLANLDEWVQSVDNPPNFEGIARIDGSRVALLVDNQFRGTRTGPSDLWFVKVDE